MKLLKILLSDITALLQLVAAFVALISATIATAAISTLLVYSLAGMSHEGVNLFLRLMNMDTGLYYLYSMPIVFKKELFQFLAFFNWAVLIAGFGGTLVYSIASYIQNTKHRLAHATPGSTMRATVSLRARNSTDSKSDTFKQAGNS